MRSVIRFSIALILLAAVLLPALAQNNFPDVVPGKFVYTIPQGFDPPMIGTGGIQEIQQAARRLRFPYYVVLVQQFDGQTDEDAADYIDSLAHHWQQDPDFDSARSSIFMLCYNPRKYRFLTGSKWEAELGFRPSAHAPFNAIFENYVQRSRKDPKTGIIRMMQAVDRHLVVESDPKTIAARIEAARKAEVARREAEKQAQEHAALQSARDRLRTEVEGLGELLSNEPRFLPSDVTRYRTVHDNAYVVLQTADREKIRNHASSLQLMNEELRQFVNARKLEAQKKAIGIAGRLGVSAFALILLFVWTLKRSGKYGRLKHEFWDKCREWDERITNAQPKYLNFEKEREMIVGLRALGGRTGEVYESTTREVDAIFIEIGSMRTHVEQCRSRARRASFLNLRPLEGALTDLEGEFAVDSRQLSTMKLFAPETQQVTIKPAEVAEQLEERFERAIAQWEHLKKAAEARYGQAEDAFPQARLDEMLKKADEHGIPHRWLKDHPLYGDDESDKTLYTRVNEGRMADPVAYLERLEGLQQKEQEIGERLDRLVGAIAAAKSQRVDSVPDFAMTVLQPQDDPKITFDAARREEARFTAFLTSRDDVSEVEEQAARVQELYRKCIEQTVMVQSALAEAENELNRVRTELAAVSTLAEDAEKMVREREHIHSNMGRAEASLRNGTRYLEAGRSALDQASGMLVEKRHLDAQNTVRRAMESLGVARGEFTDSREQCRELDEAKQRFEERLAELDDRREGFEWRIRHYGGSGRRLGDYHYSQIGSAVDYLLLISQLDALEDSWEQEVRIARRNYEELERARREAEEEEERRNSSSSGSFWSSSSSDSSSSSSGGSWGGGGSDSSSSSSSSGGSW